MARRNRNRAVENPDYEQVIEEDSDVRQNDHDGDLPNVTDDNVTAPYAQKSDEARYPDAAFIDPDAEVEVEEDNADNNDDDAPDEDAG